MIGDIMKEKLVKRIKICIARNIFWIFRQKHKLAKIEKKNTMTVKERYDYGMYLLRRYHRTCRVIVDSFGVSNLPADLGGCVFISNHQGKDDCPVILQTLSQYPTSVLIDLSVTKNFFLTPLLKLLNAKLLDMNDLFSQTEVYKEMAEEIKNDQRRFLIFPEAGHNGNKNNMNEFHSACFTPVMKTHCPVVPVCLYDTYKVYEDKTYKKMHVECHILKPIFYEEYQGLNKKELSELVKSRIAEQLEIIKKSKENKD